MKLIDGRAYAARIREEAKRTIATLPTPPGLGVLLVGDDPASRLYVNLKNKAAAEIGVRTDIRRFPANIADMDLIATIRAWNADSSVNGILVQLPLPAAHDTNAIISAIDPRKDVDGFHAENVAALERSEATLLSPVHEAVLRLIAVTGLDPREKSATILANSETFAKPLALLLRRAGFTTATMRPNELDANLLRASNVIITAIGRRGFLGADLVKPGTVIIDIGTNRTENGTVRGDADAEALAPIDGWLTPVPGGIGPMTIALLLKNVAEAARRAYVTVERYKN